MQDWEVLFKNHKYLLFSNLRNQLRLKFIEKRTTEAKTRTPNTSTGFTGSEIGKFLKRLSIADPLPDMTKRHRLYEALRQRQETDRCGNLVIAFIQESMNPVRHTDAAD
jgi:hypothetical protein